MGYFHKKCMWRWTIHVVMFTYSFYTIKASNELLSSGSTANITNLSNGSLLEKSFGVVLDLPIPQTRPFLHTYAEYLIDFLFHRPMISNPGPHDPLNSYVRPPTVRYCQCGVASNRIHRQDSSDTAPKQRFPWRVFIRSVDQAGERTCAGSIVSASWILTVASCIGDDAQAVYVHGLTDTRQCWHVRADSWTLHPFYNNASGDSDIALIKLSSPLTQSQSTQPICLPWKIRYRDFSRTTVSSCGWTNPRTGCSSFDELENMTLPFMSSHECQMVMHRLNKRYPRITNNMVCSERESEQDCRLHDYGGSLDYFDSEAKVAYQLGIPADPKHVCDGPEYYPHYGTRIVNFLDWIFNTAKDADFCVV